jgi:hypothetical protein
MPKLTATLDSIQAALTVAEKQATELLADVSSLQVNWQPNEGHSWSICQCLDHLAKVNVLYAAALQRAVATSPERYRRPTTAVVPGFFGRMFVRQLEPPVRTKLRAPAKAIPASNGNEGELLTGFLKSHEPLRAVLEAAKSIDVNQLRFKNPFIGVLRFTVGTGLMVINAHDRRHLLQAEQVKKASDYPVA